MFDVWRNWRAGVDPRIVRTNDVQGKDTVCP
jgi:hypothetical protein